MSKIDEFEQKIIKHGMTDEDFLEYGKLLKRVRGNLTLVIQQLMSFQEHL